MTQGTPDMNRRALETERATAARYEQYLIHESARLRSEIADLEARRGQVDSDLATFRAFRNQAKL